MAAKFCIQGQYKLVGVCCCRYYRDPDCFNNSKFPGNKSSGGKPCKEFKNGMINQTIRQLINLKMGKRNVFENSLVNVESVEESGLDRLAELQKK